MLKLLIILSLNMIVMSILLRGGDVLISYSSSYVPLRDGSIYECRSVDSVDIVSKSVKPRKEKYWSNVKAICSGNIIEFVEYEQPIFYGSDVPGATGKQKGGKKTKDNINRSKMALRRLINSNSGKGDLFVTLTYKDNMVDIKQGKDDFKKFIKRWNYRRKKEGKDKLKYVYVVEFQKRGAVHFHVIFFNVGFIDNSDLSSIWKNGFVKVNKIDNVDNVGSYVVKYMDKSLEDNRLDSSDLYGRSKGNLKESVEIKEPTSVGALMSMYKDTIIFSKSYDTNYRGKMVYSQCNLKRCLKDIGENVVNVLDKSRF